VPPLSLLQQPHQSIKEIGNIVNQGMAHPSAASSSFELPYLVAPPEGSALELQYQRTILLYLHHLWVPAELYLIDGFGSNDRANLVGTRGNLSKLKSIRGYQGYEPVKIGKDMEDARRWSLYENVVFIYLTLIMEKLKSLWNRWRGSTASQGQNQQR
jgi:hypothetical protein